MLTRPPLVFPPLAWLLVACLLTLGLRSPSPAHAEDKGIQERTQREEARSKFQHGVDLFREGDFRAALIAFRRAYDLSPNYRVLYNIGQASAEAQDYPAAWEAFRQYLQEGGREIPSARRAQVEGELKKLDGRIAHLTVATNEPDAEILVDDLLAGRSPLSLPLIVGAGRRKVTVIAKGREPQTRLVDVAGGDDLKLEIPFASLKAGARPLPGTQDAPLPPTEVLHIEPLREPAPTSTKTSALLPLGIATTGVLAAAAVATGIVAWQAKSSFDHTLSTQTDAGTALAEERSRTRRWALATDILASAAVATGAVTLFVAIKGRKEQPQARISFSPSGVFLFGLF